MPKIAFIFSLLLLIACSNVKYITRSQAYEINKKYLLKKYGQKIEDKDIGFYIQNGKWIFFNPTKYGEFKVIIDKKGKILK